MVNPIVEVDDITTIAPSVTRVGTLVFIRKFKRLWGILSDNYGNLKLTKLCEKLQIPEYFIDIFPYATGSYACYMGEGALFPSPKKIFKIWKITFHGCLRMSGGNQIVSCLLATVVTGASLFPRYKFHKKLVQIAHVFIRMAYTTVKPIDEILKDAEFIDFLGGLGYGQL